MDRRRRSMAVCAAAAVMLGMLAPRAGGQHQPGYEGSTWWPKLEPLTYLLDTGRWKKLRKQAPEMAKVITRSSWYAKDLDQVFAELTFYEAVAEANLDDPERAVWLWHTAQNLHRPIGQRDLAPYGDAGKLLYEHPLRRLGEVPYRFEKAPRAGVRGASLVPPTLIAAQEPVVLQSAAVRWEPGVTRPLRVELIIDQHGRGHQPLVLLPHDPHPAIVYASLRAIRERPFEPARLDGEAVPFLLLFEVHYKVIRGSSKDFSVEPLTIDPARRLVVAPRADSPR